jgi:hypothetical protein
MIQVYHRKGWWPGIWKELVGTYFKYNRRIFLWECLFNTVFRYNFSGLIPWKQYWLSATELRQGPACYTTEAVVGADMSQIHRGFKFVRDEEQWKLPSDLAGLEPKQVNNSGVRPGMLAKITRNFNHDNQKSGWDSNRILPNKSLQRHN